MPEGVRASMEFVMKRWLWCSVCVLLAVVMVLGGWLISAHLRAVEASVLERAGRHSPGLVEHGLDMAKRGNLGAAQLLSQATQQEGIPGSAQLVQTTSNLAAQNPRLAAWGGAASPRLEKLFQNSISPSNSEAEMLTDFMIGANNRDNARRLLQSSPLPVVQALLQCRALTNTTLFPPTSSAAGQPFDASICIAGLLAEEGKLNGGLREALATLATQAARSGNPQPLEEMLVDFMSLGQRLNWGQLAAVVEHVDDTPTLHSLTGAFRNAGQRMPVLFAAVELSGKPAAVCDYLANFSQTGLADLGAALRYGGGGLGELLRRNQRFYVSGLRQRLAARAPWAADFATAPDFLLRTPRWALAFKFLLYLAGGFFLAMSLHFARNFPAPEKSLQVRGFHLARESLFALGFLFVVLLLSEPFLAQDSQKMNPTFRLRLPTTGSVVPALIAGAKSSAMNPINLLTLLLFFVLQALLYLASVVKLAEIRRVNTAPRIKLRLLDNEDHLFDAGLYLGFVGTILSLILVSLGVIKPSLMAAYSSTSFGIIFVSVFKIFHLRPARRTLLLQAEAEAEADAAETATSMAAPAYASP